jgi:endosialidase-like protein
MRRHIAEVACFVGTMVFVCSGHVAAQKPVKGSGIPGTIPVWTGTGSTLADSHVQDNGTDVTVNLPLRVSGSDNAPAVDGFSSDGIGVVGHSVTNDGVVGSTEGPTGQARVAGTDAVGVEGVGSSVGVRGNALLCDNNGCVPTTGDAGQFVAGAGGILLHGFLANFNGPGGWDEKFVVDASGNLVIAGNASKPGGGSWSPLSDRRAKKSVESIGDALRRLPQLRGVTYEYANPSAVAATCVLRARVDLCLQFAHSFAGESFRHASQYGRTGR